MKGQENLKAQNKMSFKERLAIFDKNRENVQLNLINYKNDNKKENKEDKKIIGSFEKNMQIFEPKKNAEINNKINIYDSKKMTKINDNKKGEKLNKPTISNEDKKKSGKVEIFKNKKIEQEKISSKKIDVIQNKNNNNVSIKIKKLDQNIDKNKYYNDITINNKNFNQNNVINNSIINKNRNNNIILNKEIKELENKPTPKNNTIFEKAQLFSQNNQNQKKEEEQKQINYKSIKDRIAFFNKDTNKNNENKKIENEKNNENINKKYNVYKRSNYIEKQKNIKENKEININKYQNKSDHIPIKINYEIKNVDQNHQIKINNKIKINQEVAKAQILEKVAPLQKELIINNKKNIEDNDNNLKEYFILDKTPLNPESKSNSFCKAFLIVSFPKKNNKLVENSEGTPGDCLHKFCSILPSFEPEIIYKYPENDSKELELNSNLISDICFPNSIKLCFFEDEDKILALKNYRSCFTNQVGDRYYSIMYHFYIRMVNTDFFKKYYCNLIEKISMQYSKEIGENAEEGAKIINNINNKKYVYIPYCFCLLSKYPYFTQMEKCLQSILLTIKNNNFKNSELNEIIAFLVKSISCPFIHSSISFLLSNCFDIIELNYPLYQEMLLQGDNLIFLLDKININNLILLFRLLLFEQKVLLVSSDYNDLTQLSLSLITLLYPFSWIHIYIPIITKKMLKYLQSFLPFLNGMNKALYEREDVQKILYTSHKDLYIFDIDKNSFEVSLNLNIKKKINKAKFLNKNVPSFPRKIENIIINQLNIIKSNSKRNDINNNTSLNIKIKLIFIQVFIEILYDYKSYLSFIDDMPIFNNNTFISERSEVDIKFYKELTSTQLFQMFIQNSLNYENYFFDELIKVYFLDKKEKKENYKNHIILNDKIENYLFNKLYNIRKHYIIIPSSIEYKPKEKKFNCEIGKELMENMNNFLKKEFKDKEYLNKNGVLKENKRIIYNDINISNNNDLKNLEYYLTEEEKKENENDKKKENKKQKIKKINKKNFNDESKLKEIENEEIKDNMKTTLKHIFKSEFLNITDDINSLLLSLGKEFGKKYFIDIIESNKKNKEMKIISEDSFKILLEVISKSLLRLDSTQKDIIYAIKIIKFSYYFKTKVNKNDYFLNEKIFEIITNKYSLFNKINFWELWIENELNKNDIEILDKFRKRSNERENYIYIDEKDEEIFRFKDKYKNLLKDAKRNMVIMKLNKSFILSNIEYLCNKYYLDENYKKEQVAELINY